MTQFFKYTSEDATKPIVLIATHNICIRSSVRKMTSLPPAEPEIAHGYQPEEWKWRIAIAF